MNILHVSCVLMALVPSPGDLDGAWSGRLASPGFSGTLELRFSSDGASWKGEGTFRAGPDEARAALADIESEGAQLTFSATIDRATVLFEGQLVGDQITGRFHVREGGKTVDEGEWSAA